VAYALNFINSNQCIRKDTRFNNWLGSFLLKLPIVFWPCKNILVKAVNFLTCVLSLVIGILLIADAFPSGWESEGGSAANSLVSSIKVSTSGLAVSEHGDGHNHSADPSHICAAHLSHSISGAVSVPGLISPVLTGHHTWLERSPSFVNSEISSLIRPPKLA
jgi:hypothetical protein